MKEIITALAKARAKFPVIEKTETAKIKGKTKSGQPYEYSYDYAPLSEILDKTAPALSENGLALIEQVTETDSGTKLIVMLAHCSGESLQSEKLLGTFADPKLFGGAMTYYRRYLIEGLLNIASQQDKDGQGVEASAPARQKPAQPKANGKKPVEKAPAPTNPVELMELCNEKLGTDYKSTAHLLNAIKKQSGIEDYAWPAREAVEGWKFAYKQVADYQETKEKADQVADDLLEPELFSEPAQQTAYSTDT